MADSIRAVVRGARELEAALADIDRRTNRATMYAVREAGRKVKQEAKRDAPKVTGKLRASIHSSKRLRRDGDGTYAVRVAARGLLYSGKAEELHHFMQRAYDTVAPQLGAIAAKAWLRTTRRR